MKRAEAEARLATITDGSNKRRAALDKEIAAYFKDAEQEDADMGALLDAMVALKDRVEMHKTREELKEKKLRIQQARAKHAADKVLQEATSDEEQQSTCKPSEATGETCGQEEAEEEEEKFEPISAEDFEVDDEENEATPAIAATTKSRSLAMNRVVNMIELADGTRVSLAEYLRMDHRPAQKKSRYGTNCILAILYELINCYCVVSKKRARTAEEMRREGFLGPLINGDLESRKRMGIYALRAVGRSP